MEEMLMMMNIKTPENPGKIPSISSNSTTIFPIWKLYENPFYISKQSQDQKQVDQDCRNKKQKQIHHLHLPVSARKIAASFWDLTFIKPLMESELERARLQILELKTELENERKARKKLVATNKKLSREISEERKGREALESVCEELARELSCNKAEAIRVKKEIEEERKMLRVAEILREERVQMKLSEAKYLMEEKLFELEAINVTKPEENNNGASSISTSTAIDGSSRAVLTEKSTSDSGNNGGANTMEIQRKTSPEAVNHHIKRGIKGFVEFPKVVRAIGSKSNNLSGNKLECQKAQIRMLLKQRSYLQSNSLINC